MQISGGDIRLVKNCIAEKLKNNDLVGAEKMHHLLTRLLNIHNNIMDQIIFENGTGNPDSKTNHYTEQQGISIDTVDRLAKFIFSEYEKDIPDDYTKVKSKILQFFCGQKDEQFKPFEIALVEQNYDDRGLDYPGITNVRYNLTNNKHKRFADGSNISDFCTEFLNIIYQINSNSYTIYLEVDYACNVAGHSGGVEDYELSVSKFNHTDDTHNAVILADLVMENVSTIIKSKGHDEIYNAINEYLGSNKKY